MIVAEVFQYAGRFCEVVTRHGIFYGEVIRLSSVLFLIRPRLPSAAPQHSVCADEITHITPLPDPR
jgi:hypothetical protein